MEKDENIITEMVDVMVHHQRYVPKDRDGDPIPILFLGDGLSGERVEGAKRSRNNSETRWERLEGLEFAPADWHLRLLLIQVLTDINNYILQDLV